jgi:hypothetical protein
MGKWAKLDRQQGMFMSRCPLRWFFVWCVGDTGGLERRSSYRGGRRFAAARDAQSRIAGLIPPPLALRFSGDICSFTARRCSKAHPQADRRSSPWRREPGLRALQETLV